MVSIIIRTRNEERWISLCLKSVFEQDYKDFEVIVVDNKSTDASISKAREFKVKVISIDEYLPGKALNMGISASKGDLICCLSGHCIPVNNHWLSNLVRNFDEKNVAGVYGRQEPMSFTSDFDKRDLLSIFGLDRKEQVKDNFFHNANSMIRRKVWEKFPFDDKLTNIEDRVWAQEVLKNGYKIIYEPEASVYHYHGIHQDNDPQRCFNVVKILESLDPKRHSKIDINKLNVAALIPVKGDKVMELCGKPLLEYTIESCRQSKFIKDIIVSTDTEETAALAKKLGAKAPFLRSPELSAEYVDLERVLKFSLEQMEKGGMLPDLLLVLEVTYPFRKKGLLDEMIEQLADNGLDSVIPARVEYKSCWINRNNSIDRMDEGFAPRSLKEPIYIGLAGLGCVTLPKFIREGRRLGDKVGIVEVNDYYSSLEVRTDKDKGFADKLMPEWIKSNK